MTNPQTVHRCERGARCFAAETITSPKDGSKEKRGTPCDRILCDACENKVRQALDAAPALYVRLRNATLVRTTAVRTEMVTASKSSPLPLNSHALDLGEQLWWLLITWEDEVRRIARLTHRAPTGKREARQVQDAAETLAAHLTAWIAAPPTPFIVNSGHDWWWSRDGQKIATEAAIEQSGVEAASALLDWRSHARNLPGLDTNAAKAIRKYEHRCPACGARAVTHHAGDDLMQCQACLATAPYLPTLPREADYQVQQEGAA